MTGDRPVRIANCSGFFGDRLSAAKEMVEGGDIDVLTRRPVVVTAIARGKTRLLRIPGTKVRTVLLRCPQISEKVPDQ